MNIYADLCRAGTPHPDEEFIRICEQHIINRGAYDASESDLEPEDDPLWAAYLRTYEAIDAAQPQTMDGVIALARVAKAEGQHPGGEMHDQDPAARWAWRAINCLLQLKEAV